MIPYRNKLRIPYTPSARLGCEDILKGLYKSASFVVQAITFKKIDKYVNHQSELRDIVSNNERVIVDTFIHLKNGGTVDFNSMSEALFAWAKKWISETS